MSTSSDDSENENFKQIIEAVDTNFLSDSLYTEDKTCHQIINEENAIKKIKSERYLVDEEFQTDHLNVTEQMRHFVAKKLSNIIEDQIEFVEFNMNKKLRKKLLKPSKGLKLLKGSQSDICLEYQNYTAPSIKPIIKKRNFEPDPNDNLSEIEKIKLVAVNPEDLINKVDMKYWNDRKKSKIDQYKSKSGPPYQFVEPDNEFSLIRRKNSWSLKKIARS